MQTNAEESYHANGKLLLSGEYLVMNGAMALALPLNKGQKLSIKQNDLHYLTWTASTVNGHWFKVCFDEALEIISTDNAKLAKKLSQILKQCLSYRPDIEELITNKAIKTHLEFEEHWGWGSSSTLISLLSQWLGLHPYLLLKDTFGGSGYDLACATSNTPLIYQLNDGIPNARQVDFNPHFGAHIYFVYTGKKQSSKNEITRFKQLRINPGDTERISNITEQMIACRDLLNFGQLMEEHEKIIAKNVQLNTIKSEHFSDFDGFIKALGAWGGDYIMVVTTQSEGYVNDYFKTKGLNTIFRFNDIKAS